MKICKGCGAFYESKCPYCGYIGTEEPEKDKTFTTLDIMGDRNIVTVYYGKCAKPKVEIMGDRQSTSIYTQYINIEIMGDRNEIIIDPRVDYFTDIMGDRNKVGVVL